MEKVYISWENITQWSRVVAGKIAEEKKSSAAITLVAVSRGGLVPAQLIAYKLNIRDVRVIKLMSYNNDNTRGEIRDISTDALDDGENVYIIDDLADSGETMRYLRKRFPKAKLCTLIVKDCCGELPDISAVTVAGGSWLVFPWDE